MVEVGRRDAEVARTSPVAPNDATGHSDRQHLADFFRRFCFYGCVFFGTCHVDSAYIATEVLVSGVGAREVLF